MNAALASSISSSPEGPPALHAGTGPAVTPMAAAAAAGRAAPGLQAPLPVGFPPMPPQATAVPQEAGSSGKGRRAEKGGAAYGDVVLRLSQAWPTKV